MCFKASPRRYSLLKNVIKEVYYGEKVNIKMRDKS